MKAVRSTGRGAPANYNDVLQVRQYTPQLVDFAPVVKRFGRD
jgi:hypothetical protein